LDFKPVLRHVIQWLMLISDATSSMPILRLFRIRWSICPFSSAYVTVDGRPERASSTHSTTLFWIFVLAQNTGQLKKKVTLSHVYNEATSEPPITRYTTNVRNLSKFVCNWRGKVFQATAARGDHILHHTERLLLSPLALAARNTFPRELQTNFESFPYNCFISRDCWLTGYFIINMWKCYLLFELPCTLIKAPNMSV
jgi:hypothetical protein